MSAYADLLKCLKRKHHLLILDNPDGEEAVEAIEMLEAKVKELEAALREIADLPCETDRDGEWFYQKIARAALKEKCDD